VRRRLVVCKRRDGVLDVQRWHVLPERCDGDVAAAVVRLVTPAGLLLLPGVDVERGSAVSVGHFQRRRRCCVHQLQCWIRVPGWVVVRHSRCRDVSRRHVQCSWRDVMQELHRRLRVSRWIDDRDARGDQVCCRSLQRLWRRGVQQLQCRLRVPDGRVHERHSAGVCRWKLQ
jgi:hypothetical protein